MVGGIIMRETKKWEEFEIEFIRNNYTELTDYEMADQLGRTFRSVRVKRERLGLFRYFQEDYSPIKGEKWKELNGVYISNKGRVKKSDSKFLKIHVHKTGYAIVSFNGKNRYVHNLVWEAFVGKIPDDMQKDCWCPDSWQLPFVRSPMRKATQLTTLIVISLIILYIILNLLHIKRI